MANNRIRFSNDFILKDEKVGINTTEPRAELDVGGDLYVSGIVSATEFVGDGTNLTGLIPNTIEDISVDNIYYPLLSPVTSGTISSISVSSQSIVFNPQQNALGIGTTTLFTGGGTGSLTIAGKIVVGNAITFSNISNVLDANYTAGASAYRSFNLIDTSSVIKIVRVSTPSAGAAFELQHWSEDLTTQYSYFDFVTENGNWAIRDRKPDVNRSILFINDHGNILIGADSSNIGVNNTQTVAIGTANMLQVASGNVYIAGNVGIGTTNPTAKLDVLGHTELDTLNVSIAATIPNLTLSNSGIAVTAILDEDDLISNRDDALATQQSIKKYVDDKLSTEIGDVSLEFSTDSGIGTVNLATEIFGIKGTANEIETVGSGVTLTIGLPNDVIISNDLTVIRNLDVYGNVTVGGTSAIVNADQLQVKDKDIVLGITTDAFGNDVSTDFTANGGGIAIASTEGSPLVCLKCAGINTFDGTYKQLIWFKEGSFTGLGTDAWLSNYAIGIGSTQVPNGVRLAVGGVQVTDNDIIQISNINASGIITAAQFIGTASTASFATTAFSLNGFDPDTTEVGFARTAVDVIGGIGSITSLDVSGITTLGTVEISSGIVTAVSGIVTYYGDFKGDLTGTASTASFATTAFSLNGFDPDTTEVGFARTAVDVIGGIGSITSLDVSGITTLGTVEISSGIVTAVSGIVTYYGDGSKLENVIATSGNATYATDAGIATNIKGGTGGNVLYQSASNSTNFVTNGLSGSVLLFNGTIPIWGNLRAATGFFGGVTVYDEGNIVGFADSITSFNFVGPNISATTFENTGIATITFNENIVGSGLSISGISTLGGVEISSGIITSSNPGVTTVVYYGDGSNLEGVTAFYVDAQINSSDPVYPTLAAGVGVNSVGISTNKLVFIEATTRLGIGTTNPVTELHVIGDVTATNFNSTSDLKLKTNIQQITDPLEKLTQIQGVSFNWIENNKPSMGVIADELQKVLPELVSDSDPKTVNYNGLIGLLIECVKKQQEEINNLKELISNINLS